MPLKGVLRESSQVKKNFSVKDHKEREGRPWLPLGVKVSIKVIVSGPFTRGGYVVDFGLSNGRHFQGLCMDGTQLEIHFFLTASFR